MPTELDVADLAGANSKARAWSAEVNGRPHSEICAIPAERLASGAGAVGPAAVAAPAVRAGDAA